eukprot:gene25605-31301_t
MFVVVFSYILGYWQFLQISKERLVSDPSVPGFQKLSLLFIPDVGANANYDLRFTRSDAGKVVEDRAFNVRSIVDGYYKTPGVVQAVAYNP